MSARKPFIFRAWFINALRKISYRYPPRYEADKAAKVAYGQYKCAICQQVFRKKDTQMDHVVPIVDPAVGFPKTPDGRDDWTPYIERMFAQVGGWQRLCKPCHQTKTQGENKIRRDVKKSKKKS